MVLSRMPSILRYSGAIKAEYGPPNSPGPDEARLLKALKNKHKKQLKAGGKEQALPS